jgi:hypothetical protein
MPAELLEIFWDNLLSSQPEQIRAAFASLPPADQPAILAHLQRMAGEPGWHPAQRAAARAALEALGQPLPERPARRRKPRRARAD